MVPVAGRPFLEHVLRAARARRRVAGGDLPRPPGRRDRGGPRRRRPLRAVDRLLRRGLRADRHRGRAAARAAPAGRALPGHVRRHLSAGRLRRGRGPPRALRARRPHDRAAQPGPLGPEQRRLRARPGAAPTTSARPRPGAEWIDYGLLGADARARSTATSRTWPTSSAASPAPGSSRACRSARASTRSAPPRRSPRPTASSPPRGLPDAQLPSSPGRHRRGCPRRGASGCRWSPGGAARRPGRASRVTGTAERRAPSAGSSATSAGAPAGAAHGRSGAPAIRDRGLRVAGHAPSPAAPGAARGARVRDDQLGGPRGPREDRVAVAPRAGTSRRRRSSRRDRGRRGERVGAVRPQPRPVRSSTGSARL